MKINTDYQVSRRQFLRGALISGVGLTTQLATPVAGSAQDVPTVSTSPVEGAFPPQRKHIETLVNVNQVGFIPSEPKRALVLAADALSSNGFVLMDDDVTPRVQYSGTLTENPNAVSATFAQYKHCYIADFTDFRKAGRYRLRLADGSLSFTFAIQEDIQLRLLPLMLTYFQVQRCGETHPYLHGACHRDDGKIVGGPHNGEPIDGSGGWHDAGDYLKFVETTSYVTAMMLFTYQRFPNLFSHPANHPGHRELPTLLAEAKVGLDWLLKMHPSPEEFYYQVGDNTDHDSWRMPEYDAPEQNKSWKPRSVFYGVGANLAGRTAAAFAMASSLYHRFDPRFAQTCLKAALSIYQLGLKHPEIVTTKPEDFYPEKSWQDDMAWGAVALYEATRQPEYLLQSLKFASGAGPAGDGVSVYNTHAMAYSQLCRHVSNQDLDRLKGYMKLDADIARTRASNPYGLATNYTWGTAANAAGMALTCLLYAELIDPKEATPYVAIARQQRDYILGCNPFNLSFLIGAGARYPQFPHHQIANLHNVELSGALVGGPSDLHTYKHEKFALEDCEYSIRSSGVDPSILPDDLGVYCDAVQNYVTNEPANDYTVNFLLLSAFYHEYVQLNKGENT